MSNKKISEPNSNSSKLILKKNFQYFARIVLQTIIINVDSNIFQRIFIFRVIIYCKIFILQNHYYNIHSIVITEKPLNSLFIF